MGVAAHPPLASMTGFGRAEVSIPPSGRIVAEIRSVNHRFLEVETRIPEGFQAWEDDVRVLVGRSLRRGQIRVSVSLKGSEMAPPVEFDAAQAARYLKQLRGLERRLGLKQAVTLEFLLGLPQVIKAADRAHPSARQWPAVEKAIEQALAHLVRMRRREGSRLQRALLSEIAALDRLAAQARRAAPAVFRQAQKRLAKRIDALVRGSAAPAASQSAVLAEAAALAQASDVSEELARIDSHLVALTKAARGETAQTGIKNGSSPGRTIDFLAQELQREVNTLGTKLRDEAVVTCVVAMKGQIEKLREQSANLE